MGKISEKVNHKKPPEWTANLISNQESSDENNREILFHAHQSGKRINV